jgi:hypothetical protein
MEGIVSDRAGTRQHAGPALPGVHETWDGVERVVLTPAEYDALAARLASLEAERAAVGPLVEAVRVYCDACDTADREAQYFHGLADDADNRGAAYQAWSLLADEADDALAPIYAAYRAYAARAGQGGEGA